LAEYFRRNRASFRFSPKVQRIREIRGRRDGVVFAIIGNIIPIKRHFCNLYYPFVGIPLPKITDFAALLSWIPNNGLRGPWTLVFHEALTNLDRRGIRILGCHKA